ncbi:MAG: hypothetical protein QOC65_1047 [Sphingomonadales bacterium]|nr:hypothetical protein [Sphingomonadales bacterium]
MDVRSRWTFLALIVTQAAHSVEEYLFRLYDLLPPARAVSEAVALDRAAGFAVANALLVGFGLFCWLVWVRPARRPAWAVAFAWALIETLNGLGHFALTYAAGGYFPGLYTAPLLLILGLWLLAQLVRTPSRAAP